MNKTINEAFPIGAEIEGMNPAIHIREIFHYHDAPLSFVFTVISDESLTRFHAELLQTFRDNNAVWVITTYDGEFDEKTFDGSMEFRKEIMNLISKKDHMILTTDTNQTVTSVNFRVRGTYPYSVFDILYEM